MQSEFQQATCHNMAALPAWSKAGISRSIKALSLASLFEEDWEDEEEDTDEVMPLDRELLQQDFSFEEGDEDDDEEDDDGLNFDYTVTDELDDLEDGLEEGLEDKA